MPVATLALSCDAAARAPAAERFTTTEAGSSCGRRAGTGDSIVPAMAGFGVEETGVTMADSARSYRVIGRRPQN